MMKKLIYLLMTSLLFFSACSDDDDDEQKKFSSPVEGKRIAYIINMRPSGIFQLCADRCRKTAESLGMTCDVFFTDGKDEQFMKQITSCANEGYDGLYLSHGGKEYSYTFLSSLAARNPKLRLVTFDTEFEDKQGNTHKIAGVTQFFQDDKELAARLLDYACTSLSPDKKPLNVLKVWVGPGYLASFDRRETGYSEYEEAGKIRTVATIGPSNLDDACASMQSVMEKTLADYDEKEIDLIWVAYDLYAQGCYPALKASGKSIPMVSVDICRKDAEYMKEKNSLWKACACTDFGANGEQGVRILALEMNNDYKDIKAPGSPVPTDYIEMPASLITQEDVREGRTPESYGNPANFVTNSWLKKLMGY